MQVNTLERTHESRPTCTDLGSSIATLFHLPRNDTRAVAGYPCPLSPFLGNHHWIHIGMGYYTEKYVPAYPSSFTGGELLDREQSRGRGSPQQSTSTAVSTATSDTTSWDGYNRLIQPGRPAGSPRAKPRPSSKSTTSTAVPGNPGGRDDTNLYTHTIQ